jgi:hypothetical protein
VNFIGRALLAELEPEVRLTYVRVSLQQIKSRLENRSQEREKTATHLTPIVVHQIFCSTISELFEQSE